jgi:hypothetical protein
MAYIIIRDYLGWDIREFHQASGRDDERPPGC